jgi:hypothetical protein
VAIGLSLPLVAGAQKLTLPAPSPGASVSQTVGVTQVSVEYSSPGVKGRTIFGGLLDYGKTWRTGANAPTKLTVDTDVTIGGKTVPAGTYSIFSIPGKDSFTVIVNGDPKASGRTYDKKKDVVRVAVKPAKIAKRERLAFIFSNTTDAGTVLDLEWDTVRVSLPITVATTKLVAANISGYNKTSSRSHANAARYHAGAGDLDAALAHIDISIAADSSWFTNWIKADILAKKGDYKAAYPYAELAWKLGQKADYFFWKDQVKKALDEWKSKR